MSAPLFTIIIPTYNSARTLRIAIESVLLQQYKTWEIIIVDGLSKDDTMDIIKRYASADSRFRYVSESDQGIYDAMNKGIGLATGEWLYFLGSDDSLFDKDVLQNIADKLQNISCDFLYGNVLMADNRKYAGVFNQEKLLRMNISHQAIFYKRDIFSIVGKYSIRYMLHADWDFNIRCFAATGIKIQYADILVGRFGEGGVSSNHDRIFLREVIIPLRIKRLIDKEDSLRNIRMYDEWWRLLRNAQVKNIEELRVYTGRQKLPGALISMIKTQQVLGAKRLEIGVLSKFFMLLHFCFTGGKKVA